jgi:hypothetical protein
MRKSTLAATFLATAMITLHSTASYASYFGLFPSNALKSKKEQLDAIYDVSGPYHDCFDELQVHTYPTPECTSFRESKYAEIRKFLADHPNLDLNNYAGPGKSALFYLRFADESMLTPVIDDPRVNLNQPDPYNGQTYLLRLIQLERTEMVKHLLATGRVDVNQTQGKFEAWKGTPLMYASAKCRSPEILNALLLQPKIDILQNKTTAMVKPIVMAASCLCTDNVKALLNASQSFSERDLNFAMQAARSNFIDSSHDGYLKFREDCKQNNGMKYPSFDQCWSVSEYTFHKKAEEQNAKAEEILNVLGQRLESFAR